MRDSFVSSDVAHSSNQAPKPQHGYNIKHKASLAPEFQIQRSSKPKGHQFVICFSADCVGAWMANSFVTSPIFLVVAACTSIANTVNEW